MQWKQVLGVVSMFLAAVGSSQAADAEDLIAQGIKLRKDNRDQEALPLFRQALKEQPTPRAFAQLGTCEQALGLWANAEAHMEEALAHPQDSWIQKNDAALRSALAYVQQRLGSIDVWGSPPGARVSIDGEFAAALPMSQRARAAVGKHAITIEAPGFLSETRSIEVQSGALVREHVALRSIVAPASASSPVSALGPTPQGSAPPPAVPHQEVAPEGTAIHKKWWFWGIVGAVTVAAGASVYLLVSRNDECQAPMGGTCTTL